MSSPIPGADDPGLPSGPKPNPTLAGTSQYEHSQIWLESELSILEWWGSVRDQLLVPIPVNVNDSILLHYEKEVLEWWHTVREQWLPDCE